MRQAIPSGVLDEVLGRRLRRKGQTGSARPLPLARSPVPAFHLFPCCLWIFSYEVCHMTMGKLSLMIFLVSLSHSGAWLFTSKKRAPVDAFVRKSTNSGNGATFVWSCGREIEPVIIGLLRCRALLTSAYLALVALMSHEEKDVTILWTDRASFVKSKFWLITYHQHSQRWEMTRTMLYSR